MTIGLLDGVKNLSPIEKSDWSKYILSFQREDGMFVDKSLDTANAYDIHYWGWHHLLPHLIIALNYLDEKPRYDFQFVLNIFEKKTVENWLESRKWKDDYLAEQ